MKFEVHIWCYLFSVFCIDLNMNAGVQSLHLNACEIILSEWGTTTLLKFIISSILSSSIRTMKKKNEGLRLENIV